MVFNKLHVKVQIKRSMNELTHQGSLEHIRETLPATIFGSEKFCSEFLGCFLACRSGLVNTVQSSRSSAMCHTVTLRTTDASDYRAWWLCDDIPDLNDRLRTYDRLPLSHTSMLLLVLPYSWILSPLMCA
jgi:hypothetical protein